MLRKNIRTPSSQPNLPNTIATQTQDFMVYLPLQQKLSTILQEYRSLQSQYKQSQDMLEYYEFKNNILENSLHQLTFSLENKLGESKIKLCDELLELEKLIEKEKIEAESLQRITISRIEGDSGVKSKQSSRNSEGHRNGDNLSGRSKQTQRSIFYRKYCQNQSVKSQRKSVTRSQAKQLASSHNQFLQISDKVLINRQAKAQNTIPIKEGKKQSAEKLQKERRKVRKQDFRATKQKINDKENQYVDVMIKREAELNLKRFLKEFDSINLDIKQRAIH